MNCFQNAEYEILKEILFVFQKHNLRYYAIGGTCIGAVRHNGFIPWDDDIDLAMPREDYELFRTKYFKELPNHLKKLDCDNSIHNNILALRIHDPRTTMIDMYVKNQPDRFSGAFVDIMPVDGLPTGKFKEKYVLQKLSLLSRLNNMKRLCDFFPRKDLGFIQFIKDIAKKFSVRLIKYNYFSDLISKYMSKYSYDNSKKVCFTWRIGIEYQRLVFNSEFFCETVSMKFEDIFISVPKNFDSYLKQDFGNYMELPPEEERNSGHEAYIYDLSKPCEYYAQLESEKMNK